MYLSIETKVRIATVVFHYDDMNNFIIEHFK